MGACTATNQKKKSQVIRSLMPYKISMTAFIWSKNAHNLFDFESNQFTRKDIEIDFPARLATLDNELLALTKNVYLNVSYFSKEWARNQIEIADLQFEEAGITKICPISSKQDHRIWAIIKNHTPNSDFNSLEYWDLKLNDIVKLGRIRLQLIDFSFINSNDIMPSELEKTPHNEQGSSSCSQDYQGPEPDQCRVCFSRKATPENPLISPCHCIQTGTGSVKYIHVKCLQSWIGVQLKIKISENSIQYTWKKMQCEICKATFKNSYMYLGRSYSIMNIPKPRSSYLILRVTSDDKCKEGMIYVIELHQKTEFRIGRVPECDIKLKDISVSRQHAVLKLIPTLTHTPEKPSYSLRLSDINSKFGTLIYAQSDSLLNIKESDKPALFQVGRVLIYFNIRKKTKKSNVSCYKHPEGIPLFNISQVPLNDLATNVNQELQDHGSFQTHNELNMSDIVINDPPVQVVPQAIQIVNLPQSLPTQVQNRQFDDDQSVCDEHQQAVVLIH